MRRAIGLVLVLLVAYVVQFAQGVEPASGGIALALGFALIAAVLVAELAERVSLPRVTGYLLLGLVCGPYVLNLITQPMARELGLFNGLAVALVAFMAGLEINLASLRPRLRDILTIGLVTIGLMYALLLPLLWLAWPWLGIEPGAQGTARIAFALVLTVVVISFSPTVTLAVIAENRARGPFSELVLALVIFADLVLILSFTFAMQFAGWATGASKVHEVGVVIYLLWDIVGSLAFGAVLGALFALYLRFVGREVTLVLLALCVTASGLGRYLAFEPLLAALAAGLVVENVAPPRGDALRLAVERGALPVLVIFFAAAGAALDLGALAELGVIALVLSALRLGSLRAASGTAATLTDVAPEHGSLIWMGLVSQAGITLGLSAIVAAQYPTWGPPLQTLVVAMSAIHAVIGPVLFRAALAKSGEIGRMDTASA